MNARPHRSSACVVLSDCHSRWSLGSTCQLRISVTEVRLARRPHGTTGSRNMSYNLGVCLDWRPQGGNRELRRRGEPTGDVDADEVARRSSLVVLHQRLLRPRSSEAATPFDKGTRVTRRRVGERLPGRKRTAHRNGWRRRRRKVGIGVGAPVSRRKVRFHLGGEHWSEVELLVGQWQLRDGVAERVSSSSGALGDCRERLMTRRDGVGTSAWCMGCGVGSSEMRAVCLAPEGARVGAAVGSAFRPSLRPEQCPVAVGRPRSSTVTG